MADLKKKNQEPRRVLGRGLDALLPAATAAAVERVESEFQRVAVERLAPNPRQPRKRFDELALDELAESLRTQGMIQPIVVRREGDDYEIIAGERRWRAAQRAGLHEVPVVVKDSDPAAAFELALVENLQRTDLDAIETAEAYQRLLDEHGYTTESLAQRVGKSRASVANTLRLLQLPGEVRGHVVAGTLTEGHARALLTARDEGEIKRLAQVAVDKGWSVRETEAQARKAPAAAPREPAKSEGAPGESETSAKNSGATSKAPAERNPNARDLEHKLSAALGLTVMLRDDAASGSGTIEIAYDSLDQLDRFVDKVLGA